MLTFIKKHLPFSARSVTEPLSLIPRWMLNKDPRHNESLIDARYLPDQLALLEVIMKGSVNIQPSFYDQPDVYIAAKEREDITDTESNRRAIHTISNYWNSLGIYRDDFDRQMNDKLARNSYYALGEKAIIDYFGSADWTVRDKQDGSKVEKAIDFLSAPNPQESFSDVSKMVMRDMVRYDAGAIVKSFKKSGHIAEMKAYVGTEFWREQDRVPLLINVPVASTVQYDPRTINTPTYQGWWSHGYTERFWQRSRTGVYIPFQPEEICYFMMYPRTDGIYGTDFLKFLKYQIQYLIDSTKAAGKTFENGVVPSIVWEHPEMRSLPQLRSRIKELQINNQGWNKFGSVIHAVNGEKVHSLAQTLHDMQWLEGQKFVAQLIWAMWGFSQDEFLGSGSNRATAYVKRNITKSRMLYPLMKFYEDKINREILPYMRGYRRTWHFEFLKDFDLDDQQKIASINSVKAGTVNTYLNMNFPVELALKLAGVGDDLATEDVETLKDYITAQQMAQLQASTSGTEGTDVMDNGMVQPGGGADIGRYGTEGYVPVNLSDYGQGGEFTELRTGEKAEQEYKGGALKKGQEFPYLDHMGIIRKAVVASISPKGIIKAKVYISTPGDAPKGRSVRRGGRGGYYYMSTESAPAAKTPAVRSGATAHGKPSGWGQQRSPPPSAPAMQPANPAPGGGGAAPAENKIVVSGENVGLVVALVNGEMVAEMLPTPETDEFIRALLSMADPKDPLAFGDAIVALAKERGYEITA